MITETRSDIFRWRSRFRRRGACLGQPTAGEYSFQYADEPEEKQIATNIIDILKEGKEWHSDILKEGKEWHRVSLKAKVIQKEQAIQVGSKELKLAVATVAASTASIPLDIWEEHIQSIEIGKWNRCK